MSREQLLERVWKYESATETNVVDVYIRYLRSKIDVEGQPSYIKTVRGVGYAMQESFSLKYSKNITIEEKMQYFRCKKREKFFIKAFTK